MTELTANVALRHPQTGEIHSLAAGDAVPTWAKGLITNPNAVSAARSTDSEPEGGSLPGSRATVQDWAYHAAGLGIDVPEGAKKADIKELIEAHHAQGEESTDSEPEGGQAAESQD